MRLHGNMDLCDGFEDCDVHYLKQKLKQKQMLIDIQLLYSLPRLILFILRYDIRLDTVPVL